MNNKNVKVPVVWTDEMGKNGIETFEFTVRTMNCLKRAGISTIKELIESYETLDNLRGFGNKCKTEVNDALIDMTIKYKGKEWYNKRISELNNINKF